mgnify:CR=1 FL=1
MQPTYWVLCNKAWILHNAYYYADSASVLFRIIACVQNSDYCREAKFSWMGQPIISLSAGQKIGLWNIPMPGLAWMIHWSEAWNKFFSQHKIFSIAFLKQLDIFDVHGYT